MILPRRASCARPQLAIALIVTLLAGGGSPAFAQGEVPIPEPRPERPSDPLKLDDSAPDLSEIPLPEPRPERPQEPRITDAKPVVPPEIAPNPDLSPPVRAGAMPAEEISCRTRLKEYGIEFKELPQLADKSGCSVPWPIEVSSLGSGVALAPAGVFNCAVVERSAKFMRDKVQPNAAKILGSRIATLRQASAYVCRPRNGTSKLSEHAFGNALDIDSFALADKRTIGVGRTKSAKEAEFMMAVRLAACGPYTTVLGPGSNADHATHFHFDLAKRRPGSTYCK